MFDVLYSVAAFLLAISLLVAIHEFGHFWVARRLGVKILRFSIGFGKPLWKKTFGKDQTEFVIASLPLGGYVKMLDGRETDVAEAEVHRAFDHQSLGTRFAIVFAGPAFNFVFAIFAYWMMFIIGIQGIAPIIGEVQEDSPAAQAGLAVGQKILSIDGRPTPIWDVALETLLPVMVDRDRVKMTLERKDGQTFTTELNLSQTKQELEPGKLFEILGFSPWRKQLESVVGRVVEDSAAAKAGLQKKDRILRIDNKAVNNWMELVKIVSARPDQDLLLRIERDGHEIDVPVHTMSAEYDGKTIGKLGIGPYVSDVNRILYRYGVVDAVVNAWDKCWSNAWLTLKMLGKIVSGQISVKNLSGPLNIAVYAGHSASAGLARFLDFLAIVSISLGILNLLPVPVLDGGHLMFYLVEAVKGSPVSEKTEIIGQQIGVAALVLLMSLALYNDLVRLLN
ncbi:MAG TPA: RIP metalloprotease RseP [Gammaproteobacteria bacterium]|nr:RIP metalloprotease RseP [Gammaproteobacteria bacterium]